MITEKVQMINLKDDGTFPNSELPVLFYKGALDVPFLFPASYVRKLFEDNGWNNAWDDGVFEYHHYHSITHEVIGVYEGETILQLGGEKGKKLKVEKGDVLIIPAGVAHKNLKEEDDIQCIGAYPGGRDYDMNYGGVGERPRTDKNIRNVPIPESDPIFGTIGGLTEIWKKG
ncbi:MAG: cupin domain-containing protein [Mucilaginibacter sp.]